MEKVSARNPGLEQIREQGYAWVIRSKVTGKCGAPFPDEEYAMASPGLERGGSELILVDFS